MKTSPLSRRYLSGVDKELHRYSYQVVHHGAFEETSLFARFSGERLTTRTNGRGGMVAQGGIYSMLFV
jgi:histidyl-tRNA synthetase